MILALPALARPAVGDPPTEPILETYSLRLGEIDAVGVTAHLVDDAFGRGAHARLLFRGPRAFQDPTATGTLSLRVWRRVPRGGVAFALLVFRVEIRGFDAEGALVDSRDLPPFSFGDSASGNWTRTVDGIPAEVVRMEVKFVGNFE